MTTKYRVCIINNDGEAIEQDIVNTEAEARTLKNSLIEKGFEYVSMTYIK